MARQFSWSRQSTSRSVCAEMAAHSVADSTKTCMRVIAFTGRFIGNRNEKKKKIQIFLKFQMKLLKRHPPGQGICKTRDRLVPVHASFEASFHARFNASFLV